MKNSSLKNLVELYHENRLSHAYLIETNDVDKCFIELKEVPSGSALEKRLQEDKK